MARQLGQPIHAQAGPQTDFVECGAQIAIYGGAAGGGKSYGLLLDAGNLALRYPGYGPVIFRRTSVQVFSQGGLWETSEELYPLCGGSGVRTAKKWSFPNGSTVSFAHLEHDKDRLEWQGSQIPYIGFDELTHFSALQFWYLRSRLRSQTGGPAFIRGTCNPDPDSFVRSLIAWWLDEKTGYAIPERSGILRWFARVGDDLFWADKPSELVNRFALTRENWPTSMTFIPSTVEDNPLMLRRNPHYISALMSLPTHEREQLRFGNWNVRPAAGSFFARHHFGTPAADYPRGYRLVRFWDRAATDAAQARQDGTEPDWTVGVLMTRDPLDVYWVINVIRCQIGPGQVPVLVKQTAEIDTQDVEVVFGQDPASAGKIEAAMFITLLTGFTVKAVPITVNKQVAAKPASSQVAAGNVRLVSGDWNEAFLNELENFPVGKWDDQVDAFSGAFNELALGAVQITATNYALGGVAASAGAASVFRPGTGVFRPRGRV